jgi:hypothetical protein
MLKTVFVMKGTSTAFTAGRQALLQETVRYEKYQKRADGFPHLWPDNVTVIVFCVLPLCSHTDC